MLWMDNLKNCGSWHKELARIAEIYISMTTVLTKAYTQLLHDSQIEPGIKNDETPTCMRTI
jgi:hypothetical protein